MAGDKKGAAELGAWLVFVDETGLLMAPHLRRTWAPRRHAPVVHQRVRWRQKVSMIGALCLAADRRDVRFYFRLHPNANIRSGEVRAFVRVLRRQLDGPVVLVWDRFGPHRARVVRAAVEAAGEFEMHFLPPYAPELNPAEAPWGYLKMNRLANWGPPDVDALASSARRHGRSVQRRRALLRSFLRRSPLAFDLV